MHVAIEIATLSWVAATTGREVATTMPQMVLSST
jgi:hypothetical protein